MRAFLDRDRPVHDAAVDVLKRGAFTLSLDEIATALSDPDPATRHRMLVAIGEIADPRALAPIDGLAASDPDASVRATAATVAAWMRLVESQRRSS
ncbi:MAG: HEAT repeat domain-containing protein [Acidobacteriota bacterium]